jgi:hypothetical protein
MPATADWSEQGTGERAWQLASVASGGCVGLALAASLPGAFAIVSLLALIVVALRSPERLTRAFLASLALLLLGYALLGRGFAYLGAPPLFVGECVLALGIFGVAARWSRQIPRLPLFGLIALLLVWGASRAVPGIPSYGLLALRDAATIGYAIFALLIAVSFGFHYDISAVPRAYARAVPLFLGWTPLAFALTRLQPGWIPVVPGTDVPLLVVLPGDSAVHLAGVAGFVLLGLDSTQDSGRRLRAPRPVLWTLWIVSFLTFASINRAGMLAALAGLALVLSMQAKVAQWLRAAFLLGSFCSLGLAFDFRIDHGGPRQISTSQLIANLQSVVGLGDDRHLAGTREWRMSWWEEIVDYTVFGPYFWTGRGFGINLADTDAYQVDPHQRLRSPHNGHMTLLARTGVPGLSSWLILQVAFAGSLIRAHRRMRALGQDRLARLCVWTLGYWMAAQVNITFGTALESPQAGIWFWSIFGLGLAAIARSRAIAQSTANQRPPGARLASGG